MTPQQQLELDPRPALHEFPFFPAGPQTNKSTPKFTANRRIVATTSVEAPRTVRVALAGCGVVGGGFVRLLHESATAIAARFGVRFDLTRVLVRDVDRDRNLPLDSRLFTNDLDAFLAHDADVVIEAVGGDEPARTIASAALRRGKKVITANKELVAAHGDTLSALACQNDAGLDFGAAVGGSAPVISTLRDLVGASAPLSVRGILNGTSNYVISLLERGESLETALESARKCGLAEADCARDLDGRDAAAKLAIIAWITFGIRPAGLHIRRTPLVPGLERLVRLATIEGARIRLIAECTQLPGHRVAAAVEPVIVASESAFGRTTLEENRVEVDLGWPSPLSVSGPGAGGRPTAAALLSDLLRVSPPPNDRGPGATQFISVADPRDHRWLVAARLDATSLEREATAIGLRSERLTGEGSDATVITAPVTWNSVQRLIAALELSNAAPCIARYELGKEREVLQ
ncbi:MAG: homoserine dehydrogenase [Gemmatimonadota bacterium]|nr:homoserine dehydrogenase [Gemmatimonadota bacterium]